MNFKEKYGEFKHCSGSKVREIYCNDLGDEVVAIATDRLSAFDKGIGAIPDKGKVLTAISAFWSMWIDFNNEMPYETAFIASNAPFASQQDVFYSCSVPREFGEDPELSGRVTHMVGLDMFPVECVVRGHIAGSIWRLYEQGMREICGVKLPDGLRNGDPFPDGPIFTPTTKAETGHDVNITFSEMADLIERYCLGDLDTAETIRGYCLDLYERAYDFAFEEGLIIADTKFELGLSLDGEIVFGDEILTPDSSRFWDADKFDPGREQPSYDKQIIRDYISRNNSTIIPDYVIQGTRKKYIECYEKLVGLKWPE